MTTKKPTRPSVKLVAGHATTTSTAVAQFFGKRHNDVLRAIDTLIKSAPPEKADWCLRNFAQASREVDQPNGGKTTYTEYQLTRDAFALLAMGFTGKEAFAWKIKYIEAFNKLEQRAQARAVTLATRKIAAEQAAERRKLLLSAPEPTLEDQALSRLRAGKFVLYFGAGGFMTMFGVSRKAIVAEPEDLAAMIADAKSEIGREHLPGIIQAAAQRLA